MFCAPSSFFGKSSESALWAGAERVTAELSVALAELLRAVEAVGSLYNISFGDILESGLDSSMPPPRH